MAARRDDAAAPGSAACRHAPSLRSACRLAFACMSIARLSCGAVASLHCDGRHIDSRL